MPSTGVRNHEKLMAKHMQSEKMQDEVIRPRTLANSEVTSYSE